MSYDIYWHKSKQTIEHPNKLYDSNNNLNEDIFIDRNLSITFNVCKTLNWAFSVDYWVDEVHSKKGKDISDKIYKAVDKMYTYPDIAESFNGYGSYVASLIFLKELLFQSMEYKEWYCEIGK